MRTKRQAQPRRYAVRLQHKVKPDARQLCQLWRAVITGCASSDCQVSRAAGLLLSSLMASLCSERCEVALRGQRLPFHCYANEQPASSGQNHACPKLPGSAQGRKE